MRRAARLARALTAAAQGYALVEFEKFAEAQAAIKALDGSELMGSKLSVNWAFKKGGCRREAGARACVRSPRPTHAAPGGGRRGRGRGARR